jgi:hypothetical protein
MITRYFAISAVSFTITKLYIKASETKTQCNIMASRMG